MSFCVYILLSLKLSKYYVGQTCNMADRLRRHNSGYSKSTKGGLPWKVVLIIKTNNRTEAMKLERKIKKRGVKRFLEDNQFMGGTPNRYKM